MRLKVKLGWGGWVRVMGWGILNCWRDNMEGFDYLFVISLFIVLFVYLFITYYYIMGNTLLILHNNYLYLFNTHRYEAYKTLTLSINRSLIIILFFCPFSLTQKTHNQPFDLHQLLGHALILNHIDLFLLVHLLKDYFHLAF